MNTQNGDWRRGFRVGIWSGIAIGSVVVATIVTLWLPYVPDVLRYLELDGESMYGRIDRCSIQLSYGCVSISAAARVILTPWD